MSKRLRSPFTVSVRISRALALGAALWANVACSSTGGKGESIAAIGKPAPEWNEPTASAGNLASSALRGKVVYLNFFASWCGPCNEEAPQLEALQRRYGPAGLQIVGVDLLEDPAKGRAFARRYGLSYPIVVDSGALRRQYAVNGLPVHAFIDRHGVLRRIVIGEMSAEAMRRNVGSLL